MLPNIIIFVGLPASGKTTISKKLCLYLPNTVRINQDEQTKEQMKILFANAIKTNKLIIVDNCNLNPQKRSEFIIKNKIIWCIFVDTEYEECVFRIKKRTNHPTIKNGLRVLEETKNKLIIPSKDEGFNEIFDLKNDDDIMNFYQSLNISFEPADNIIKFVRTKHLVNLGAASRDDLLYTKDEVDQFINVPIYVEEKVDGANLGISIDKNYKIKVQNRSHYIDSSYHPQFALLDKWISKHSNDIINLLEPEKEILFGEWLYMKHSIEYTSLSDFFIAFDIYNVDTKQFISRYVLTNRLSNTSIKQVPLITRIIFENTDDIIKLVNTKSQFYDGPIEGVYLRICDELNTVARAKIVRNNFISGNDHWTKEKYTINKLQKIA